MGMFDYVDLGPHAIKCPICGAVVEGYQTKDSPNQSMSTYRVNADGLVEVRHLDSGYDDEPKPRFQAVPADFCGAWQIYGGCSKGCKTTWHGYETTLFYAQLVIMDGKLHRVKPLQENES